MKKLKKFAALLLVGVMALALLTACGGGGGPTEEQKVTVTAKYTYSDTLLSSLLKTIESSTKVSNKVNANVKQNGTWSNVGVVVITDNEQSYIGLSIRVKNPKK